MTQRLLNRAARRRHQGQTGFTLIELLIVIAVLGILAAIVIFNVTGVTNKGDTAKCNTDLKTVQTASDAYFNDHGSYGVKSTDPTQLDSTKFGAYIHSWPTEKTWTIDGNGTITNTCP
jgi:general secretion pathway protein G